MILAPFELHRPTRLDEALALASAHAGDFDWLAGGTDMLQNYKNRLNARGHVIALDAIEELGGVGDDRLGAMTRLTTLADDPRVRERWPGLADAAGVVASPLVRNSATLGGNLLVENRCFWFNQTPFWRSTKGSCLKAESDECRVIPQKEICYAAYSGDLAPVLMVLGASIELASPSGRRTVALADFYRGDGIERNVKAADEIVVTVLLPPEAATLRSGYEKLRHRDTLDYPEMGVAAALGVDDGGRIATLRCAHTAVDTVPRLTDYTNEHAGRPVAEIGESIAPTVATDMEASARPSRNTAMPVGYRKKMVRVYLERLLRRLAEERTVQTE
jgi:4-hydroxybenzoyl-CoA reductase subunit beta